MEEPAKRQNPKGVEGGKRAEAHQKKDANVVFRDGPQHIVQLVFEQHHHFIATIGTSMVDHNKGIYVALR